MEVEEVIISKNVLSYGHFKDSLELVDWHSEEIDGFNELLHDLGLKHHDALDVAQHLEDHLKDNVLHAWEVEGFYWQLNAILNANFQVDFFLAVALHAQHQVQVQTVGPTPVDLQVVDKVIQHICVETFDVFNDQQDWPRHSVDPLVLQDSFHPVERLTLNNFRIFVLSLVQGRQILLHFVLSQVRAPIKHKLERLLVS